MPRLEQALTEADVVMGFTQIARQLLCGDEERENEAAKKYGRLTDYVTDQILDRAEYDGRLEKVLLQFFQQWNVLSVICVLIWIQSKKLLLKIQRRKLMKLIGTVQMDEKVMCWWYIAT